MRTRQRYMAAGAFTLAASSIGGGAFVTSHAMADETPPPTGTLTVVSMTGGTDSAIKCVFDGIDLPTLSAAPVGVGGGPDFVTGSGGSPSTEIHLGTGPVDADGTPLAGAVFVTAGAVSMAADGTDAPTGAPTLITSIDGVTPAGSSGGIITVTGSADGSGEGTLPAPPAGVVPIDISNVREGTAEECAALQPSTTGAIGSTPAAPATEATVAP